MAEFWWLGPVRESVRTRFFRLLRQSLDTDDGRQILGEALRGLAPSQVVPALHWRAAANPYLEPADLNSERESPSAEPVLVTGRFRSGSTLLWNLFRHVPECTAYYEPLNERRWFDPLVRGDRVDRTHLGVDDYWKEYDGLAHLARWYRPEWCARQLYMDADTWAPDLRAYIQGLIDGAPGRPVLQFNRVDFRLPWLRRQFPRAHLIHVYRHPRDQWCSSLVDLRSFPPTGTVAEFAAHDHFYLLQWARDLRHSFPFLDPARAAHPYALFYGLWRLSYAFGRTYADASFSLEALCETPHLEIPRLMRAANVPGYDLERLVSLVVRRAPDQWKAYADASWFQQHEAQCDGALREFFGCDVDASPAAQASLSG